ncbi:MAG TPA: hypothetical protein VHU84_17545 [Lacipirellulaceae bacterium]|jgi:hypothetical protein|nr:hypothetical protein [Lacipirellulaceae bacterium]
MFRRILRSTIVLGTLIVAYQAYAILAVPLMEPSLEMKENQRLSAEDMDKANHTVSKYQRLLAAYFPRTHWSQTAPPKVIANGTEQAMLVFDDYTRSPGTGKNADGSPTTLVDIKQIAFLIFPTSPHEGAAPRDAIILEGSQGAHLEFDEFRPEVGKIGQIIRGEFPGPIVIHSDMKDPGPEDDLLIEVSDLAMNTKLLYTSKPNTPVRFRMGQNIGGGTDLEIRFLADEHVKPGDTGLKIAGIDTLEIRRDVKMRLQMDAGKMFPSGNKNDAKSAKDKLGQAEPVTPSIQVTDASAVKPPSAAVAKPPVDISCTGPFTFDAVRYVASYDQDVQVLQTNPNGPSDQLVCSRLDVHFAPKPQLETAPQQTMSDPGKRQQHDLGRLQAVAIVAEGHPVVMTSPARNAQASGERIQIAIPDQRVRISGGNDTMLVEGTNVLKAPIIDYQQPAAEEATAVGRFRATGPGTLHYVTDPAKPEQILNAEWQGTVQLGREKGQPVLVLDSPEPRTTGQDSRPKVSFAESGSLTAEQIRLYLRELAGEGSEGISIGGNGTTGKDAQKKARLAPDRMLATGHVEIASPQFTGHAQSLTATFRLKPADVAQSGAQNNSNNKTDNSAPKSKPPGTSNTTQPDQKYYIDTDQMLLEVSMAGQAATPLTLTCNGHVTIRQVPLVMNDPAANQQPLEILGGQLFVDQLDTKTPHVTLHGVAPGQLPGSALAQMTARGTTLRTDTIELDQRENRMWSNGPGKATILMAHDMTGNQSAAPVPTDITWRGGLKFDGQTVLFQRNVFVNNADSKVNCDELAAKLSAPIQFGQHVDQANVSLNEIECRGQVAIDNVQRDPQGVTSHAQMTLARLNINQQTGAMNGDGPGTIRTTRFGNGAIAFPGQAPVVAPQPNVNAANAAGSKLFFLRVDFHQGLVGNIYTHEVTFHDRVRSVYGPVDAWEQELDPTRPESLPSDSMLLTCQNMRVNEDAVAARTLATTNPAGKRPMGPLQMQAEGDVRIAGQVPNQGEFNVQSDRASYDQAKDAFILEGDTRTPAKLWRRNGAGVDAPPTEARKIRYVRSTGETKVDGIQYIEVLPSDLQNARRTPPTK